MPVPELEPDLEFVRELVERFKVGSGEVRKEDNVVFESLLDRVLTVHRLERDKVKRTVPGKPCITRLTTLTESAMDRICTLYKSGKTVIEVSDIVGIAKGTVYNVLKRRGVERRPALSRKKSSVWRKTDVCKR